MNQTASLETALQHAHALLAVQPARAAQQAAAILEAVPDHPEAILIQGAAFRRQGMLAEAHAVLEPLARTQPRAASAQFEWAMVLTGMGETGRAIAALRRAVALRPSLSQAWRMLGDLLLMEGEPAQADAAYGRHIQTAIHDPALMEAAAALAEADLPRAEKRLRAHLHAIPTDVAAIRMLAEIGTRLGRYAEAENLLARCLDLTPSFTPARHNLAVVLFRQDRAAEALPHIEQLLADDPYDPSFRNLFAACLATLGEYDRAIEVYGKVLSEFPQQPRIWLSYGHALKTAGRRVETVAAYKRAIALAPGLGEAHWSLANLKNEPFSPADIDLMRAQLDPPPPAAEDRFHLHYALGAALEQAGDHAESFTHYAEGARLRRGEISYNADRITSQLARTREMMSAAFFERAGAGGCDSPAPIFVVGLPRSGSTLIEQILSSHSAIEGTMELPEMANVARALGRSDPAGAAAYLARVASLSPHERAALGRQYLDRTRIYRKLDRPFFIDKMPNNFVHVGLIRLILPNAKIIDARRHPMAACFSGFKQHFARGQHFSYDLTEIGRYFCDYAALMDHFDTVLPGHVHRVVYEAMVTDTEAEVRRLLAICGLPFEPACLRPHENQRAVRTASSEQVRRPITREGLDHWRHYAPWLGPLREALGSLGA